jgi:cell division protease FtsH
VTYRESQRSPVLAAAGADLPAPRSHSEQTAREIDEEVRRIVDAAMTCVRRILETRRPALEAVARRLIECEVIDGDELRTIVEKATDAPQLVPGTAAERRTGPRPAAEGGDVGQSAAGT